MLAIVKPVNLKLNQVELNQSCRGRAEGGDTPGPRFINVRRNLRLSVIYATQIYGAQMMPFHKDTNGFVYAGVSICCCVKYQVCVKIG